MINRAFCITNIRTRRHLDGDILKGPRLVDNRMKIDRGFCFDLNQLRNCQDGIERNIRALLLT